MIAKILILENAIDKPNFIFRELNHTRFEYRSFCIRLNGEVEDHVQNYNPDVILFEYHTDQNNAEHILKRCHKYWPSTPIILIADHIEMDQCVNLIKKGASDILLKKNITSLSNKISAILEENNSLKVNGLQLPIEDHHFDQTKYSSLIRNSSDAILLTINDGEILEANPAACQLFKMTEDEICRKGRDGLLIKNDPNLSALVKERNINGIAKGELNFKRKDGSCFIGQIISVVFKNTEGAEMASVIIKDLTQSKKADKDLAQTTGELQEAINNLNKIMNASMDLIFSIDADQKIVSVNAACKSILGYESHELVNRYYFDFAHTDDHEILFRNDVDIISGNPMKIFETRIIHKNGSLVYILLSAQWDAEDQVIYCTAKDITEIKKLEKAYEVERERFLDLYNLSPACMAILKGPNHIHELTNFLYLKFLNKKDVIGKSVVEVMPEMLDQGIIGLLDTVYNTGTPFIANEMLIRIDINNDGFPVDTYMNFMYQAHRNSEGKIDGIFVFAIDVTEQVLSRIQIEENEGIYHQLISELPIAAYSCDADGKILFFNKAAARLWGTAPEIGQNSYCGFSKIFDVAGQVLPIHLSPMAISLKEGRIVSGWSGIVERADGERRYVVPHVVPYIDASGRVTGAVNMIEDITDRIIAQKSLDIQNEELAFQNLEKEKRAAELEIANTELAFQNLEKENRADELIIANQELAFQNDEKEKRAAELVVANTELAFQNKEKENRADELIIANQELAFQNDEKEKRAKELILTNMELVKINKELDRFVYSISHDLRSPITSIQGLITIIEDESEDPETLKHTGMITNSLNRLDEFVKKILIYSQNNRTELEIELIPLKQTILNIITAFQNTDQAKGIRFEIDIQELSPFCTDRLRFVTVVENLISNAIKYHKSRGTDRFIKVTAVAQEKMLWLEIVDNGIGVPSQYKEKIFEMFFRISSKSHGSGIGLYIVKDTVEKLKGSIDIITNKDIGTTFKIGIKNFNVC